MTNTRRRSGAPPRPATVPSDTNWLMCVRTRCIDPGREDEFADWYNNIDIPDVLEVPGYLRARRGALQLDCDPCAHDDGDYIALYDIRSDNIDKTIIDMLMATRRMEQRGRSTDLIEVTERVYYRKCADGYCASVASTTNEPLYLFFERFDSQPKNPQTRFANLFGEPRDGAVDKLPRLVRATRYELYRVLMLEPKVIPRFLTVYEIAAQSSEQACTLLGQISDVTGNATSRSSPHMPDDRMLFLMIREEVRE